MSTSNSQVPFLLLELRGSGRSWRGGKQVLGIQHLGGVGLLLLDTWSYLGSYCRKFIQTTTTSHTLSQQMLLISQDGKVEGAGSSAVAEAQSDSPCPLTVAGASVPSWTSFHHCNPASHFTVYSHGKKSKIACC